MASLQKFIDELQALENANPGSQIFFGDPHHSAAYEKMEVKQEQVSKKVWKGIRWISAKSKLTAFVLFPVRK